MVDIDPWSSDVSTDYDRIIQQFGLESVSLSDIPNPSLHHRRDIIFAHRDLGNILQANARGDPFGVMTGLMPSGQMHLGHKMVIDQVRWFQEQGADVTIAVADLEANATRGYSLAECRKVALEEYIANYVAMGLDPARTNIYFQSMRPIVQRMGFTLGKRTNLSEFEAIYGFQGDTNLAHVQAPLVQAGDILHPQLDEYGGLRPIVVPVGVDQDPHLRLCRGLAGKTNWFNVNDRKNGGLRITVSVMDENQNIVAGDKSTTQSVFAKIVDSLKSLGYGDIMADANHGIVDLPAATPKDRYPIRMALLTLERSMGGPGLLQPSSTYHRFALGMTGGKMSSSMPETTIFLTEDLKVMEKKFKRSFSGGQSTVEEHRRLGGNPDVDVAFQYLKFFFEEDDTALDEIRSAYVAGDILSGELKMMTIEKASAWLTELAEMRDQNAHLVSEFLAEDAS
ncbi:MAG TPA: tryptophan--tRNA ligase [Candidatus Thalassarchaeaceae archaeon]|jgi:tryptophanyl-tRNA synthetase|nr:tryptophan--tRNA ligase [Candidatus Thalassarchaeaceae archaeon]HJM67824.1 tryptophan--tRNA ligase [Candidatus Thalassarchaeaceae archaeon]